MKKSAAGFARLLLVDAGPIVAYIDRKDAHHAWARDLLPRLTGRWMTCEACVSEAAHLVENHGRALQAIRELTERCDVAAPFAGNLPSLFDDLLRFAPEMDVADGCLVHLARSNVGAIVITTDDRHFSILKVPFWSPRGLFAQ